MVNTLITPTRKNRISIAAGYQTVPKTIKESDDWMVWQDVLCETTAPELTKAQPALTEFHAQSRSVPHQNLSGTESGKKTGFSCGITTSYSTVPSSNRDRIFYFHKFSQT
jgi:hypothetical protein